MKKKGEKESLGAKILKSSKGGMWEEDQLWARREEGEFFSGFFSKFPFKENRGTGMKERPFSRRPSRERRKKRKVRIRRLS